MLPPLPLARQYPGTAERGGGGLGLGTRDTDRHVRLAGLAAAGCVGATGDFEVRISSGSSRIPRIRAVAGWRRPPQRPEFWRIRLRATSKTGTIPAASGPASRGEVLDEAERDYLISLLARNRGNVSQAAKQSGLSRQGLHRLLKKHGITAGQYRDPPRE